MKRTSKPICETTSPIIAPTPTRRKGRKQESAKQSFQNSRYSSRSLSPLPISKGKCSVSAYKCGCDYSTDSIHSFKNHVLDVHRGEFLQGSTHFLSGMTKVVLPCIQDKHQSSQSKNESTLKDSEWKTRLKEQPHQIWWNGFVLIKNRLFKRQGFYCGHCRMPFARTIDFINHCLIECGQLQNETSSHFVYDETHWKIKVKKNQFTLKTKPKLIIEEPKSYKQPQQSKSDQILKYSSSSDFQRQIMTFTVHYFSTFRETPKFTFMTMFIHINDKIIYNNRSQQNSNIKNGIFKCFTCDNTFSRKFDFYKHLYVNGERQDVRSSLLVLNREIFYQKNQEQMKKYLQRQKYSIQNRCLDYEFLKYLAKKNMLPLELDNYFQQTLKYEGIFKSFYLEWCNFQLGHQLFKCETCGYITRYYANYKYYELVYSHIYQGNSKCYNKNYAFIYLDDFKRGYTRKKVILDLRSPYLKDENFICPCQKHIILSKVQFVNHVVKQHQGVIHIRFYSEPSIFE